MLQDGQGFLGVLLLAVDGGGVGVGLGGFGVVHAVQLFKSGGGLFVVVQGLGEVFLGVVGVAEVVVDLGG